MDFLLVLKTIGSLYLLIILTQIARLLRFISDDIEVFVKEYKKNGDKSNGGS